MPVKTTKNRATIFGALVGILAAYSALVFTPADAADLVGTPEAPVVQSPSSGWTYEIDPIYTWVTGFNGDLRVFGNDVSVDVSVGDIFNNLGNFIDALDGFYMGSGEMRNGKFGFQYDIVYLSLGATRGLAIGPITGAIDVGFGLATATLTGNYRVYKTDNAYMDAIAGVRITDVDLDVTISLGPTVNASDGDTWVDPIVGVKGRYDFTENWYLKGNALYGGFGVSSKYLFDVAALAGYEWGNGVQLYGGWRVAKTDYSNGSFKWDTRLSGPMLGLSVKLGQ